MSPLPRFLHPSPASQAPFVLLQIRQDTLPLHQLVLTPALRTTGLLSLLSDAQLRLLLTLLTFQAPSGLVEATVRELAMALGQHEDTTHTTLEQLQKQEWQGGALVYAIGDRYRPSKQLLVAQALPDPKPAPPRSRWPLASREQVVSHSQQTYGHPRADVEKEISRQLAPVGLEDLTPEEAESIQLLRDQGVPIDQARLIIASVLPEEIRQQIAWLPYRGAKTPARYLVAACLDHYAPPRGHEFPKIEQELPNLEVESSLGIEVQAGDSPTSFVVPEP